jgi:hypothetical protein
MGFLNERELILVGPAKVCATLAPNMQFYFYRINEREIGTKMFKGHLPCCSAKKKLGLIECLLLEILSEWLWHSVP